MGGLEEMNAEDAESAEERGEEREKNKNWI